MKKFTKNELQNELKLRLPATSRNESVSRAVVAAFCMQADPTVEELADIKCALSEAFTNCTVHAYRHTCGYVYISALLFTDRTLILSIRDTGCGIADIKKAREPLFTTDESGDRSGMGFAVMESFTDKLRVFSRVGKGTTVRMVKHLS